MRRFRPTAGIVGVAAFFALSAAVAVASGKVFYEAGSHAKPPYVFLTVSHGKVTKIRWAIHEPCGGTPPLSRFTRETQTLDAPIRNGHFSKTVHYTIGSSALGTSKGTTKIKGTISGTDATVKVSDEQDIISWGNCTGSRKFKATETTGFH